MYIREQNEIRTFLTQIRGVNCYFRFYLAVACAVTQSSKALNECHIRCCANLVTAFRVILCSRWVLHISSGNIGKVTISCECGYFLRKAWHIQHDGSYSFSYDTFWIPSGAVLRLFLGLGAQEVGIWALPLYIQDGTLQEGSGLPSESLLLL